jgi:hypothetical protein
MLCVLSSWKRQRSRPRWLYLERMNDFFEPCFKPYKPHKQPIRISRPKRRFYSAALIMSRFSLLGVACGLLLVLG